MFYQNIWFNSSLINSSLRRVSDWTAVWGEVWVHGLLWRHPLHGPSLELRQLLPRLPPELHQEVGSIPGLSGRRYPPPHPNPPWHASGCLLCTLGIIDCMRDCCGDEQCLYAVAPLTERNPTLGFEVPAASTILWIEWPFWGQSQSSLWNFCLKK